MSTKPLQSRLSRFLRTAAALASVSLLTATGANASIIFDTTSGYASATGYTGITNYQVTSPFTFNLQQWAGFKFNSGEYTTITDFSVALVNRAIPNPGSTESLAATLTMQLVALGPGALTDGDRVAGSGLNPGTALFSAPGVATLNSTPTLVTASGLNWAISPNTNYELVAVGSPGSSYGLVQPNGPALNAFASVSGTTVVPLPSAVWLFGSALGLVGAMRRRAAG